MMLSMNDTVSIAGTASALRSDKMLRSHQTLGSYQVLGFIVTVGLHALAFALFLWTSRTAPVPAMKVMSVRLLTVSPTSLEAKVLETKAEPEPPIKKPVVMPEKTTTQPLLKRVLSTQPAPVRIIDEPSSKPVRSEAKLVTSVPDSAPAPVAAAPAAQPVDAAETVPPRFDADYLNNPEPHYPAISRRLSEQGRVLLRVHVGTQGQALEVLIYKSSQYERLDQAAQSAVKDWRFVPAKRGNQALSEWVIVPIAFNLSR